MCHPPDGEGATGALETYAHGSVIPPLAAWETPLLIRLLPAASVAHPPANADGEDVGEERCENQ